MGLTAKEIISPQIPIQEELRNMVWAWVPVAYTCIGRHTCEMWHPYMRTHHSYGHTRRTCEQQRLHAPQHAHKSARSWPAYAVSRHVQTGSSARPTRVGICAATRMCTGGQTHAQHPAPVAILLHTAHLHDSHTTYMPNKQPAHTQPTASLAAPFWVLLDLFFSFSKMLQAFSSFHNYPMCLMCQIKRRFLLKIEVQRR